MSASSSEFQDTDLAKRMRLEWDRRIDDDYRFWMGDGVANDAQMWATGERDFSILFRDVDHAKLERSVLLELGCGVGRLTRSAAQRCSRVIGVDVSEKALLRAQQLLSDVHNVQFVLGNGSDLHAVDTASIDVAYSFATLSHVPVRVAAAYLLELSRVLKSGGELRVQLYLGQPQETVEEDTLAIRCFEQRGFESALRSLGFSIASIAELQLPFEVSDLEAGAIAFTVTARKEQEPQVSINELLRLLCANPEPRAGVEWKGSATEYLMAVNRAQSCLDSGRIAEAKRALEFAVQNFHQVSPDVLEVLNKLRASETNGGSKKPVETPPVSNVESSASVNSARDKNFSLSNELFEKNLTILRERFPRIANLVAQANVPPDLRVERATNGEPLMRYRDLALDNQEKPARASEVWAERVLQTFVASGRSSLTVIGFAGGYHIDALCARTTAKIHVIEPSAGRLRAALSMRDCSKALRQIASLALTLEEIQSNSSGLKDRADTELVIHPQTQVIARSFIDQVKSKIWSERGASELRPSIAVVGPIYGGTLPITHYTANALGNMKQRVRTFDLSNFGSGYFGVSQFVKSKARADVLQTHYVEMLSQIVLEGVTERPVDIVICMAQAPLSPRVLTELRSRGIITAMWFVEDCRRFQSWKLIAPYFDYMFIIQKDPFPTLVEQAGAGRAIYLPVACEPSAHRPIELTPEQRQIWGSQISFVGAGYHNRQQMFASLANRDFKIWGTEWPTCLPFSKLVQAEGKRISPDDYIKIFNASEINLNLHSSMERDGVDPYGDFVNPRTVELAACGAFQLTDNRLLLPEMFDVGREIITFSDRKEMLDKIDYYLAHPAERIAIATLARQRAIRDHSYEARLKQMLGHIYADRYDQIRARVMDSPWQRTLDSAKPYPELFNRLEAIYEQGQEPTIENLAAEIQDGKGALTDTEKKLLFLHHVTSQINIIETKRSGGRA